MTNLFIKILFGVLLTSSMAQAQTQVGADIDGEAQDDRSGWSVAFSSDGSRVAIGATFNSGTATGAGHVRVYDLIGGTWTQVGADIDGEAQADRSGTSVAFSSDGSRVAIGADRNSGTGGHAGHVRVYDLIGGTWTQVGADIDGEAGANYSGRSVSLSSDGSRVAIGAPSNSGTANGAGHVRVYDLIGGTWTQVGADIDGEAGGDNSGWSVSLSSDGSRVAIGAPHNGRTETYFGHGHVRVYDLIGGMWTQVGADIDGETWRDWSGWSVSLSSDGSRVASGAPENGAGYVRVYDLIGGTWTQVGADIDGEAGGDNSGWSVSLSSDGSRVASGAWLNDGTATGAGHVRIYDLIGGTWTQVGTDIDGEAGGDRSGYSVALSSDGSRVAIGAYRNDGTANGAGHVRVYDLPFVSLSGTVIDAEAGILPGTMLTLTGVGAPQSQVADANGIYLFTDLDPGTYTLQAELAGYNTEMFTGIVVNAGASTTLNVTLTTILPVELTRFDALAVGDEVQLTWQTATETNNAGFEIQTRRAESNAVWQVLDWVEGFGTTIEAQSYSYRIEDMAPGTHDLRLRQVDFDGQFEYSPVVEVTLEVPGTHRLYGVYPNPFNPEAVVKFVVGAEHPVRLALFNVYGQHVETLYEGTPSANELQQVRIDGSRLPSGTYMVRLTGPGFEETQPVTLIK